MSRNFRMDFFDSSIMEIRRKRDYNSLKKIYDLCRELESAIIEFNNDQEYYLTPLFRADETIGNIRIVSKIMADRIGETNDSENKQEKENTI